MIFQDLIDVSVSALTHPLLIPCQWFGAIFAWLCEANIRRLGNFDGAIGWDLKDILALSGFPPVLRCRLHGDMWINPGYNSSQSRTIHVRESTDQSKGG